MQTLKTSMEIITLLGLKPNCILYDKTPNESNLKQMLQVIIFFPQKFIKNHFSVFKTKKINDFSFFSEI